MELPCSFAKNLASSQADDVCTRVTSCNPLYPLVVCELPYGDQGSHNDIVNPGFSIFLKLFSTGALITQ